VSGQPGEQRGSRYVPPSRRGIRAHATPPPLTDRPTPRRPR
jgi:hypothetical protein